MRNLYLTDSGSLFIDDNNKPTSATTDVERISRILLMSEDTNIVLEAGERSCTKEAKAGDIVIVFYDKDFPHKVIVVNNEEWVENINTYNKLQQQMKEEWAKNNACVYSECESQKPIG